MRRVALFLFLLVLLVPAGVRAEFYNDSNVINLGPGFLPDTPADDGSGSDEDAGAGGGSSGGGESSEEGEGDDTPGTETTFGDVAVTTSGNGSSAGSSGNDGANSVSAQSLMDTLSANLAISGSGTAGTSGFGGGVDGARARAALLARGILSMHLPDTGTSATETWGGTRKRVPLSRDDVALVISSTSLTDEHLVEAQFTQDSLSLSYRASGRLLFFIPKSFIVRVALDFNGTSQAERVKVRFPWYKFVLKTGVPKGVLERELDAAITAHRDAPEGFDATGGIFSAVADVLRSRHGSIELL